MANEYCGLSVDEVRALSPDLSRLRRVEIDNHTWIFIDPDRDPKEAKRKYIENLKFWREKHDEDI
uniref:hypothetical protein n=1 Tax=Alistipes sp. TaxID=1872444 RepID=UPI0040561C28